MFFDFLGDNFFNLVESSDFNERAGFVLRLNIPIVDKYRTIKALQILPLPLSRGTADIYI